MAPATLENSIKEQSHFLESQISSGQTPDFPSAMLEVAGLCPRTGLHQAPISIVDDSAILYCPDIRFEPGHAMRRIFEVL
jgi:hypothetical protein